MACRDLDGKYVTILQLRELMKLDFCSPCIDLVSTIELPAQHVQNCRCLVQPVLEGEMVEPWIDAGPSMEDWISRARARLLDFREREIELWKWEPIDPNAPEVQGPSEYPEIPSDYGAFIERYMSEDDVVRLEAEIAPKFATLGAGHAGEWMVFSGGRRKVHFEATEDAAYWKMVQSWPFPTPALIRQVPLI